MKRAIIFLFSVFLFANIHTELKNTKTIISKMNTKLDILAKEIAKKQRNIDLLNKKIYLLNKEIQKLQNELKNSNKTLGELIDLQKGYRLKLKKIKDEIDSFLSTNYYLNSKDVDNVNDLIYNELSKKALDIYSVKIEKLAKQQEILKKEIKKTAERILAITQKQNLLKKKKNRLLSLLYQRKKEVKSLKRKKEEYKQKLLSMIQKEKNLQNKLKQLLIIKEQKYKPVYYTYRGMKTIAPIRGKVIKKFGSYIDPVYKIRIYNDSITIKPFRQNEVVRAIMPGKVVYIGEANNKKIIVLKHKNNVFSIYANLSKVSPILKKGFYVKRGQIIARVKDTLEFEITYKDKPINPLKVIKLK